VRDLFGLAGPLKRGAAYLLVREGLAAKFRRRTGEALLNLKDLLAVFRPNCRATFRGFVVLLRRGEADLLIPRGLLAKSLRRTGEALLNLKDLLTVSPPSLKRLFENERLLSPLFCTESHQIPPLSAKTWQNMAEYGRNRSFPRLDFG